MNTTFDHKRSQIEHNWLVASTHLKISIKMNHFPKVRGENSKNIWVATTQIIYHFPLGILNISSTETKKNPPGPWWGSSTWHPQDFTSSRTTLLFGGPSFLAFGLGFRLGSVQLPTSQLRMDPWGGNMQLMTGNLEIRWVRKPVWGWEVYPSMRPIFFLNQVFETSQVVFSPEFLNHQQYYRAKIRMVWGAYLGDSLILQWKNHVTGTPRGKKHLPTSCKFFMNPDGEFSETLDI